MKQHWSLFVASSLFLIATTISVFTSVDILTAAGEWKAFYIEPFLIFLVLTTTLCQKNNGTLQSGGQAMEQWNNNRATNLILLALILSGLITSLLAIYQHYTGWLVPYDFWKSGRMTSWYGFPNAVGLFLAPIMPLALYLLVQTFDRLKKRNWKLEIGNWSILISSFLFLILSTSAILFAKSTGALVGMATGIGILLLFYKKTRWPTAIICLVGLLSIFSLSSFSNIRSELTFQDRSGQIRLAIYHETWEFLKDHPFLGAGLASYQKKIIPYHTTVNNEGIEIFHHPHNIFLTMWVNIGLLGLIGFVWILVWFYSVGFTNYKKTFVPFLLSAITVIVVAGIVDSPYIKNDLAILFWVLPALLILSTTSIKKSR